MRASGGGGRGAAAQVVAGDEDFAFGEGVNEVAHAFGGVFGVGRIGVFVDQPPEGGEGEPHIFGVAFGGVLESEAVDEAEVFAEIGQSFEIHGVGDAGVAGVGVDEPVGGAERAGVLSALVVEVRNIEHALLGVAGRRIGGDEFVEFFGCAVVVGFTLEVDGFFVEFLVGGGFVGRGGAAERGGQNGRD